MATSPVTSWQIDGETMETATDFIFLGSRITADGDCSHEIKRFLLLGRKSSTATKSLFAYLQFKEKNISPNYCGSKEELKSLLMKVKE